jgi:hypothetical protein
MTDNVIDAEIFFIARTKVNRVVQMLKENGQDSLYDIHVLGTPKSNRFYEFDSLDDIEVWLHNVVDPVRTLVDLDKVQ